MRSVSATSSPISSAPPVPTPNERSAKSPPARPGAIATLPPIAPLTRGERIKEAAQNALPLIEIGAGSGYLLAASAGRLAGRWAQYPAGAAGALLGLGIGTAVAASKLVGAVLGSD
jgi:hypothetical protein